MGDLVNEAAHQGDASLAIYGVVPYLVEFALYADSQAERVRLLTHAGLLCADLRRAALENPDEDFVVTQYNSAKTQGAQMLSTLLVKLSDFSDFQYGIAALAGFLDKWEIARVLETLELFEGKLHHPWFQRPVSPHE
ncbi:MAG: hypothetical protein AAFN07_12810 [Pseudomonadota bacterium]